MMRQEMGNGFGVGAGLKHVAQLLQLVSQRGIILNDAIVDERDVAGAATVGVGIDIRGLAVGGPAGVADAQRAFDGLFFQEPREFVHPAGFFANGDLTALGHRHARAVIAAVFQAIKPLQEQFRSGPMPDVADNPTHAVAILVRRSGDL